LTDRKLGAIHTPAPPAIRPLAARAHLALMTPPRSADWLAACPADGDPLGNDAVGNCVPCAELRTIQVRRANARGDSWRPTRDKAFALYAALTGFNPMTGLPDDGTDTAMGMASWATGGIRIDEQNLDVVCWATVDPADAAHIAIAIGHTGPVQVSLALPKAAEDLAVWSQPPGNGAGWEPGSWGCHRVIAGKFDGLERVCRTWGQDVVIHPAFWSAYVVAVDATLSREWMEATGLAPSGLDWDALQADLTGLPVGSPFD
jgi:hypothetical protein